MKVTILGCGDINKIYRYTKLSKGKLKDIITNLGKLLASKNVDLIIVPARGIPYEVAEEYKKYGGKKVIGIIPKKDKRYGIKHIKEYLHIADEEKDIEYWYHLNGEIAAIGDVAICLGMSSGAMADIVMLKYHYKYLGSKTKLLIFENTISQRLPKEVEEELKYLHYVKSVKEVDKFL